MPSNTRTYLRQLLWLFIALGITLVFSVAFISENAIDIQLYDTYFILPAWLIFIPLFSLLTFAGYLISENQRSYSRTIPNWLIIISGAVLILALRYLSRNLDQLSHAGKSGWVIYPPLSALKNSELPWTKKTDFGLFINVLTGIQFVLMIMLLFVAYHWGARKRNRQLK